MIGQLKFGALVKIWGTETVLDGREGRVLEVNDNEVIVSIPVQTELGIFHLPYGFSQYEIQVQR